MVITTALATKIRNMFFLVQSVSVTHDSFDRSFFTFAPFSKQTSLLHFSFAEAFKECTIIFILKVWPEAIASFHTPACCCSKSRQRHIVKILCYIGIQRNLTQEHKYKHNKFHRVINTAYGDLDYIRIPAKEVSFNCVSLHTPPQHFSLGGRHLRKNYGNEFESKGGPVSQPRCS